MSGGDTRSRVRAGSNRAAASGSALPGRPGPRPRSGPAHQCVPMRILTVSSNPGCSVHTDMAHAVVSQLKPNQFPLDILFFRRTFSPAARSSVRAYLSLAHAHHARKGNLEGCSASASSRTHTSGVCSSPVGSAGARQQPPTASRPRTASTRIRPPPCGALLCEAADEVVRLLPPSPRWYKM